MIYASRIPSLFFSRERFGKNFHEEEFIPLYQVLPQYPSSALRDGVEGSVLVEFTVSAKGKVTDPKIIETTYEGFSEAALEAIKQWHYAPRIIDGEPVDTPGIKNLINFVLSG